MGKNQAQRLYRKQQELKEKERQAKAEAFLADYKKIVEKHGIKWTCELEVMPAGISPRLRLAEAVAPAVTSWPEAQGQNLETRKECSHDLSDNEDACKLCGLEKANWGADAKGVSEEYETRKRAEIEEALAAEQSEAEAEETEEASEPDPEADIEQEASESVEEPQEEKAEDDSK